jgi:hypothetical protein
VTRVLSTEKEIISYTVPNQIGESEKSGRTIRIEVPFGTDLSSIVPEIIISPDASILPVSGEAVDFTIDGFVTYTVTAEDGSTAQWTIYVSWVLIKADDENIQYTGRIDFSNPERPRFWSPGVYIKAKFSGTYCEIVINDEILWGSSHNYLDIVIDETNRTRVQTTARTNYIKVAEDLPDGEHTVLICKDTEASIGYLEFLGFKCEGLIALEAKPTRKLEFIGNSITCGAASDLSEVACEEGTWYDQHNAYLSYGPEVARRLNAQWYLTSYSGIGVIHSCCGMTITMPEVFNRLNLSSANNGSWDFSQYVPDAVTICLGQNDGIQDSTEFCDAYVNFIEEIRGYYPDAYIICLTSPMADASLTNFLKSCLTGIVNHFNTDGDNKVTNFFFSQSYNSGCGGHPDINEHQIISDELEPFLKQTLGW